MFVVMNGLLKNMTKIVHLYIVQNANQPHGIEIILQVEWSQVASFLERKRKMENLNNFK